MKILFPDGGASDQEIEEILAFSTEGRKRVKDQLMRIDSTYAEVDFSYDNSEGKTKSVTTLEEREYPNYYFKTVETTEIPETATETVQTAAPTSSTPVSTAPASSASELQEQHLTFDENQRGISYDSLFAPYLKDARELTVTDPYIRLFYQTRNFMELLETFARQLPTGEEAKVHLVTVVLIDETAEGDKRKTRKIEWQEVKLCQVYKPGSTDKRHQATMGGPDEAGDQWLSCAIAQGFNQQDRMKSGDIDAVMAELDQHRNGKKGKAANKPEECHRYIRNRPGQFEYAAAKAATLTIGSGEIESSDSSIVQKRLKIPGAWWKPSNAGSMLCLRTLRSNGEWDQYWERTG